MRAFRVLPLALLSLALPSGCSSTLGSDPEEWVREVGWLAPELSSIQMLKMPAQATAGVPFGITVTTVGSSSCTRADGADVVVSVLVADVTPWDRVAPQGTACTEDLAPFPRDVTLRFDLAGTATVRLHGRGGMTYQATLPVGSPY